jgi:hypothetical protein
MKPLETILFNIHDLSLELKSDPTFYVINLQAETCLSNVIIRFAEIFKSSLFLYII